SLQKNTKGIGENSVNGGSADNLGKNSGVMKSGDAIDSGKGGGSVDGGYTLNEHTNNHIMQGGMARNKGVNNGGIEGGNSANSGLNNNELNGGSATNESTSLNNENSFIKGGNAIRELQDGIEKYQGMQKQLALVDEEVNKKNDQLSKLQKQQKALGDQSYQSDETKQHLKKIEEDITSLKVEMGQTHEEVKKLNANMNAQHDEIVKLKTQSDDGQEQVKQLREKMNTDKEELQTRFANQEARNKKQTVAIDKLNTKIDDKQKEMDALKLKLESEGNAQVDTNPEMQRLGEDFRQLQATLSAKSDGQSKSQTRMDNLEARIRVLEKNEKTADLELKEISLKQQEMTEKFAHYEQTVIQDKKRLDEVSQVLNGIGKLTSQGKDVLAESSNTTTTMHTTSSYSRETKTSEGRSSAGYAHNSGENSGFIRGGDSVNNSYETNTNNEINIHKETNINNDVNLNINVDQTASKISESASALAQNVESTALDVGNSVKGAADNANVLIPTKSPYQVY
ncbi:hypothetical protein, partial [Providencia alcalifaciens]|uniref:hypothetical protein n=1 Tax=Providencia alcalifaciens TaxID=126385 RepID=UPI002B051E3C